MKLKFSILVFSILFITSCSDKVKKAETILTEKKIAALGPDTALEYYLNNDDKTFQWEIKEEYSLTCTSRISNCRNC